jgi:hypothetical protein
MFAGLSNHARERRLSVGVSGTQSILCGETVRGTIPAVREDSDPFACFRAAVLDDPSLQQRLREIVDWQAFADEAIPAAAARGIELTREGLDDERRRAQQAWRDRWV